MSKTSDLQLAVSAGSLDHYLNTVFQLPVLSAEQERCLAVKWRQKRDLEAARQLVLSQLRFVVYIAKGYTGYGLSLADLIQEGNIGLMKAVKRFDPNQGVRLISFAVHWIRAEIHEFILRNWRIVKVATTKAQRKLFFNLRRSKKRLGWFSRDEVEHVARDLGVTPATVREMEMRLNSHDVSFDAPVAEEDDDRGQRPLPATYLSDRRADPAEVIEANDWTTHTHARLNGALAALDDRSQEIITKRWLQDEKATLHELADEYGVSAERIRQIEASALKKMKTALTYEAG